jgi:hypothetical protein
VILLLFCVWLLPFWELAMNTATEEQGGSIADFLFFKKTNFMKI